LSHGAAAGGDAPVVASEARALIVAAMDLRRAEGCTLLYETLKTLHILGTVLLLGNVTVTAFWKVMLDRTGDARQIATGQYLVTVSDWMFTGSGILLIILGGYGAAFLGGYDLLGEPWLVWSQGLFFLSGAIWLCILVPIQIRQARDARGFAHGGTVPPHYRRDARAWLIWGIVATVPLVAALTLMVFKRWP
jgi:uncharacterized membrane protein